MPYTTHGYMTAEDMADMRDLYDLNPEPITLGDLARELDATPDEVAAFGDIPYCGPDELVDGERADAIRETWEPRQCRRDQYGACRDAGIPYVCN